MHRKKRNSKQYVNKILQKDNVKGWKQKSCPKLIQGKFDRAKSGTRALLFPNFELSAIVYINYNSYFPLKIKGITGNKFFMDAQRLRLELVFLMKFVLSQNLITKRGFWYRLPFLKKEFSAKVGEIVQSVKN